MCHREAGGSSSRITNRVIGRANQIAIRPPKVILSVAAGRSLTDHASMSLSYTEPSMMNPPSFLGPTKNCPPERSGSALLKRNHPDVLSHDHPVAPALKSNPKPNVRHRLVCRQIQLISTPTALPNAIPGRQTKTSQSEVGLDWARYSETDVR